MCGIVGYVGAQQAAPILLEGLQKLEYRGYDSAGIAVLDGSTIELAKACGEIKNLLAKTHDGSDLHGYIGLGHTRWATHGAPTEANAHPHVSNDGKFAIVQNGIIENFMELREMLQAKGFRFHSETDTEVIVHLLDMYYTGDGNLKDTVMKTLGRLEGSYAIGILCADCPEQMFLARNGCPLIIGVGAGENFFASDVTALVSHTKNVVYLDDGELARCVPTATRSLTAPASRSKSPFPASRGILRLPKRAAMSISCSKRSWSSRALSSPRSIRV